MKTTESTAPRLTADELRNLPAGTIIGRRVRDYSQSIAGEWTTRLLRLDRTYRKTRAATEVFGGCGTKLTLDDETACLFWVVEEV